MGLSDRVAGGMLLSRLATPPPHVPLHEKLEKLRKLVTQLEIIVAKVAWREGRREMVAYRGDTVQIADHDVVRTFLKMGWAVLAGQGSAVNQKLTTAPAPQGGGAVLSWESIPGISQTSLEVLQRDAAGVDPLTVTDDQLQELLGSAKRAGYVRKAIAASQEAKT